MISLDLKDRKILSLLDMDARTPLSQIAKQVGLSREVVHYRIQQLEKKGIIEGYYTALDVGKLGYLYCRIFLKYRTMSPEIEKGILTRCQKTKGIIWVTLGEGKWDFSIVYLATSLHDFEKFYDQFMIEYGDVFQKPYLSIAFRIHHFKHSFLYPDKNRSEVVLGTEKKVKIDAIDLTIIHYISKNARASLMEIAQETKTTAKIVNYRLQKLVREKVILAFRAKLNTRLLGYDYYKVFLSLQHLTEQRKQKLYSFLKFNPHVIFITKPMGVYNLEFEVMVQNANQLHELMQELRYTFGDMIIDYETILYYSTPIARYI